jgi:hypothetical protein
MSAQDFLSAAWGFEKSTRVPGTAGDRDGRHRGWFPSDNVIGLGFSLLPT